MKAKIILLIVAVALVTLSFTFTQVTTAMSKAPAPGITDNTTGSEPVGGFAAIEITK